MRSTRHRGMHRCKGIWCLQLSTRQFNPYPLICAKGCRTLTTITYCLITISQVIAALAPCKCWFVLIYSPICRFAIPLHSCNTPLSLVMSVVGGHSGQQLLPKQDDMWTSNIRVDFGHQHHEYHGNRPINCSRVSGRNSRDVETLLSNKWRLGDTRIPMLQLFAQQPAQALLKRDLWINTDSQPKGCQRRHTFNLHHTVYSV